LYKIVVQRIWNIDLRQGTPIHW